MILIGRSCPTVDNVFHAHDWPELPQVSQTGYVSFLNSKIFFIPIDPNNCDRISIFSILYGVFFVFRWPEQLSSLMLMKSSYLMKSVSKRRRKSVFYIYILLL